MKCSRIVVVLAMVLVAADLPPQEAIDKERVKLQGTWIMVPEFPPGSTPDPDYPLAVQEITSDKICVSTIGPERPGMRKTKIISRSVAEITFVLDPTKDPKTIDFMLISGQNKGRTFRAIYQLEGDVLTVCRPREPDGARPTEFARSKEVVLWVSRRSSPEALKKFISRWEKLREMAFDHISQPVSRMAKPIDPQDTDVLLLTLKADDEWEVPGREEPLATLEEIRQYLKEEYAAREKQLKPGPVKTAVVLRPEKDAHVIPLSQAAQQALSQGFPRVFLQVLRSTSGEGRLELLLPHWRRPLPDLTVCASALGNLDLDRGPDYWIETD